MSKGRKINVKTKPNRSIFLKIFGFVVGMALLTAYTYAQQSQKRILIIGAGPSGLVAAKSAMESGLIPTILEKDEVIGGAWKPQKGLMWHSMRTNISRYNSMFSDFPWPAGTPDFPNNRAVYDYLREYTAYFNLNQYIHFNSEVLHVKQQHNKWQITWKENGKKQQGKFDYVIIATGMFSKPYIPALQGMNEFQGEIIHSKDYKNPALFADKRVVIVGGMFSGSQIATDLCHSASRVTNVINRPAYILDRYLQSQPHGVKLPIDLVLYKREAKGTDRRLSVQEKNLKDHAFLSKFCKGQGQVCQSLLIEASANNPAYVTISETYLSAIQAGDVEVVLNKIDRLDKDGIVFKNGEKQVADAIILCTGYELDLSFLDKKVQEALDFMPSDRLQPVLLHKNVFHPKLPNLAFVGIYRGTYWGVMELQARWASMIFSGMLQPPSQKEMLEGIRQELKIREQYPKLQFPHDSYKELMEDLGHEIGVAPDWEDLKDKDPQLYWKLVDGPIVPANYRLYGFGKKPDIAKAIIEDLHHNLQEKQKNLVSISNSTAL